MKNFWRTGEPFIWLTGGGLAVALIMVAGLVLLILVNGLGFFWPKDVVEFTLTDGRGVLGQVADREPIPTSPDGAEHRIKIKQGNRDVYGADFVWLDEQEIAERTRPTEASVVERREWGNLYGILRAFRHGDTVVAEGPDEAWKALQETLPEARRVADQIREIETDGIGKINFAENRIRLKLKKLQMSGVESGPEVESLNARRAELEAQYAEEQAKLAELRDRVSSTAVFALADGSEKDVAVSQIVRVYRPNQMNVVVKTGHYLAKLWEFVSEEPRESNTEGGVFPAIFGTVMMVFIMSILVMPLGVLAALYLREYAKQGPFVSTVRIAVNNLAGVPSIVFGVFGVGFFIYFVGGTIDRVFFAESLPTPTFGTGGILWASLTLALLTVPVVIVATEEGLAAAPRGMREASLALGATKFETTWRVVLPSVMPSILTGLILAMARAAGEVAPLMITGVVKLAPALPVDSYWPYVHLDRKFMHLGFHIYDVGFQSPNVDAARPMVYSTALLLLVIVIVLNLTAITLRNRLRRKYRVSAV